jgi:hypothetical protein
MILDFGGSVSRQIDRYTCPATLAVTVVPSGSTTIKNWFIGPATVNCSAHSPMAAESPLTISELVKLPNESRSPIFETATMIAATIRNNMIKAILYKLVRLTAKIGCRIGRVWHACRYSFLWIRDERAPMIRTGSCDIPVPNRSGSIKELRAPSSSSSGSAGGAENRL